MNIASIHNYFTFSQPRTIVRALDKSLVEAQALYDYEFYAARNWWVLGVEDIIKYSNWNGRIEEGRIYHLDNGIVEKDTNLQQK